jgi:YVTN family beta-propeller protein
VSGGGPTGLVLDQGEGTLYVLTRFDNSISVIDTGSRHEIAHVSMFNPEPSSITTGRRFLYDARHTSAHGDSACASCHIFGDFDSLAWDLGDPDNIVIPVPGASDLTTSPTFVVPLGLLGLPPQFLPPFQSFQPLKGPMTTQSLRGMANHGSMHWRGDRTGGNDAPSVQPSSGIFDEDAAFKKFNVAFPGLLGRSAELSPEEMQAFTDFILQVTYPPNPIRNLDNSLTPDQQAGRDFFFSIENGGLPSDGVKPCNGCHVLDPNGNAGAPGVARPGFFGTDGRYTFEGEPQTFKVPHLRNLYQKVGMFGLSPTSLIPDTFNSTANPFMGDQVRGFGFLNDGSIDTLGRFHSAPGFAQSARNPGGIPEGPAGETVRRQIEAFLLAFDSNLAPIVGQQVTLTADNGDAAAPRITLLEARAAAGECDLVVKGFVDARARGYFYAGGKFTTDRAGEPALDDAALRALAKDGDRHALTFTCVPPGSGVRIGIDRDADGVLDGDAP